MRATELIALLGEIPSIKEAVHSASHTISLEGVSGSLMPLVTSLRARTSGGIHLVVADDKESAAYYYNDVYNVLELSGDPSDLVYLMPSSYKRSIVSGREESSGIAARTAALGAIASRLGTGREDALVICTYPEALVEKVVSRQRLEGNTLHVAVGERMGAAFIEEMLQQYEFSRVDFVSQPGEYATRGGIVDVFSFSASKPYRIEMFGEEIESIRTFAVGTQLSEQKVDKAEIVPNLKSDTLVESRVSLIEYIGERGTLWLTGGLTTLGKVDQIRTKLLQELENPRSIDEHVTSVAQLTLQSDSWQLITAFGTLPQRPADEVIQMKSKPQPAFSKNFKLLVDTVRAEEKNNRTTYILSDNIAQLERLEDIFSGTQGDIKSWAKFEGVKMTLHGGFGVGDIWVWTDHQIFERFHKYKIHNEIDRSSGMTISELNTLRVGDFVVHIDHGVGKFGGLVRQTDNGVRREYIKLTYRDGDVLMVGVHNLHRISKFKSGDAEQAPKVHKLGGSVWAKAKAVAKSRVKEMARELIALYAKRKASRGFAFSPDTYLQTELEASFIYEDTPDQLSVTKAIKADMEAPQPMDRLVCGDVGFGKTEIAIRAAFKAATDGKQVAVLVPTTVLSLQHYRSFKKRLKDFPVRVENFSRVKTSKQTSEIVKELKDGRVDILIGTHKLLGKSVEFKDLGLLIIDEEQKFGVANKEKLRQFKANIDTLTLTATPIPRTLQFSLMGARDMSIIATPPPNRQPVQTEVHPFDDDLFKEAIEYEVNRGGQVFVLHNRVQTIDNFARKIRALCPDVKVAVGHGQMPPAELEKVMMDFIYGEFDVFVATTIIESGIDIPNANTIIINNAQMFGLSDLHQLRGRVGRTNRKAFCYLFVPSLEGISSDSQRRLRAIEEFSDLGSGFNIAMQDLDIRGAGNILGGEQSGFVNDIGYETYQKIISEAVNELKAEQGLEVEQTSVDCLIESDSSAHLPDEYIASTNEKIRLYRELDGLRTEEQLQLFIERLTDRFGTPPADAQELFEVVRLRGVAESMAVERIVVKNNVATLYFSSEQHQPFYQSAEFSNLLRNVSKEMTTCKISQKAEKLTLTIRAVKSFQALREKLTKLIGAQ